MTQQNLCCLSIVIIHEFLCHRLCSSFQRWSCCSLWVCVLSESSFPVCFLIQGCVPLPSCFATISVKLPSCLVELKCARNMWVLVSTPALMEETVLLCCVLMWSSPLVHQHHLTPLRSDTDKERHGLIFPHSDVSACENHVRNQPVYVHFEFLSFVFVPPAILLPSSLPPDQTLPFVSDTCWEVTESTLLAQTLPDISHKRKTPTKRKSCFLFLWLTLFHHWWNINFLATLEEFSYFPSGCCFLTLADLIIGCLLCWHYRSQLSLLFCNRDKERIPLVHWIWPSEVHCLRDRFKRWPNVFSR